MIIPERIKIGRFMFAVERPACVDSNRDMQASICWEDMTIRVQAGLPDERASEALFHELVHGATDWIRMDLDEAAVCRISQALYMVLADNGLLAEEGVSANIR